MRYTPEEQLEFIFDNDLDLDFMTAIMNNNRGYAVSPVNPVEVKLKDGQCFMTIEMFDGEVMELPCSLRKSDEEMSPAEMMKRLSKCIRKNRIAAVIITDDSCTPSDTHLYMMSGDLTSKSEEASEDLNARLTEGIFKDCIERLGLDTRGKIRSFIREGQEIYHEWELENQPFLSDENNCNM